MKHSYMKRGNERCLERNASERLHVEQIMKFNDGGFSFEVYRKTDQERQALKDAKALFIHN